MSEPPLVGIIRIHQLACSGMGSPFYADLLERMADDVLAGGPVGRFLGDQLDTSYEEAVPLRFLGGVHRLFVKVDPLDLGQDDGFLALVGDFKKHGLLAGLGVGEFAVADGDVGVGHGWHLLKKSRLR